jgi:hypothetical protein
MIITRISGGLGNQMFQGAAGLALARHHGTTLALDTDWFQAEPTPKPHEQFALDRFDFEVRRATPSEIERAHGTGLPLLERWSRGLARRLGAPARVQYDGDFSYDPRFFTHSAATYLHGNWQSEKYFAPAADLVRRSFQRHSPPPPALAELGARIRRGLSVCVHFRRGDYVTDPVYVQEIGALGLDYYQRALALARAAAPGATLWLFSDDIEGVARDFTPDGPHEFVREPPGTAAHDTLWLMSQCDHFIIANSTLSWWAAWLGAAPGKFVLAPYPWFAGGNRNGADIVPERWQRLPRHA